MRDWKGVCKFLGWCQRWSTEQTLPIVIETGISVCLSLNDQVSTKIKKNQNTIMIAD